MREWWSRRGRPGQIALIILAVYVVLLVGGTIALAASGSGGDAPDGAAPETTTVVATTEEATTSEEATTEEATTQETTTQDEAGDEDTGRMSDTEFEQFSGAVAEVDDELGQFGSTLQRCGVLLQALEFADASECVGEAYSGIEEDVGAALFTSDDLKADVANGCLKSLTAYENRLNRYANYLSSLHASGENLQFRVFNRLAKKARKESRAYATVRDVALVACAPS